MIYITGVLANIRYIINEAETETDSFTEETDEALIAFVEIALRMLTDNEGIFADASEISDDDSVTFSERPDGMFYARIKMPDDYQRFVSVFLEGWNYPVAVLYPDNSPIFSAQYSSAKGIGNGPSIPVAFVSGDRDRYIIAHSVKKAGAYSFKYVPVSSVSEDGEINLSEKYSGVLAYYAAGLYHQSVNAADSAQAEFKIAKEMTRSELVAEKQ